MPQIVRGSRASFAQQQIRKCDSDPASEIQSSSPIDLLATASDPGHTFSQRDADQLTLQPSPPPGEEASSPAISHPPRRQTTSFEFRPTCSKRYENEEDVYYDSRAATAREYYRRPTTLQLYYQSHPELLPQLPFTFRHGWPRYRLFLIIVFMIIDACVIPIALYYAMSFGGNVEGWIVFLVISSIWGVPTYIEFTFRCWKLIKKENFYRPLNTVSRWSFDITHWIIVLALAAVTSLLIVGSAPHYVWLRVLSMPAPAILYALGGSILILTVYHIAGWNAPFRLSSTPKGSKVLPGIYYIVEDIMAVNVGSGRPWREAMAARYEASPRFRRMIFQLSIYWSIPALLVAGGLTAVAVVHTVPTAVAYGICWGVPFIWAGVWGGLTVAWVRRELRHEANAWETDVSALKTTSSANEEVEKATTSDSPSNTDAPSTTESPNTQA